MSESGPSLDALRYVSAGNEDIARRIAIQVTQETVILNEADTNDLEAMEGEQ